ncbi:MAG TPA: ATP-binding protein [Polyangiales bacterium]|nr:ATP-binding protein [Polyangiales bacterium]
MGELFSEAAFMPHGHCYLWTPSLVWTEGVSNLLIGLSYVAISSVLALFVHRLRNLPFRWAYVAFGIFIVSCGFTHFLDVLVIWQPRYWLDAGLRAVTAVASMGTALMLPRLLPQAQQLAKASLAARERGIALEMTVSDLESMYKKTLELDQLKTNFFANVSHELRTPLTLILGPVEHLLLDDRMDGEQRYELELVARNARSLLAHVNNLLDIAKLDAGKLEPRFADTDMSELVRSVSASFDSLARERKIALAIKTPAVAHAEVDIDKVQRVLLNLLSNAFKYAPEGGSIRVELRDADPPRHQKQLELVVADDGPGVPESERRQIFERFRQGESSSTHPVGGTGLGLSIVREFVGLHGGEVHVGTSVEGGAEFQVTLPRHAPDGARLHDPMPPPRSAVQATVQELHELPDQEEEPGLPDDAPTVLVVDDNADMRALLVRTLRGRYRVAQARDGVEGLEKARKLKPDLILSDLMMPRMSGDELVLAVRAQPELSSVPILLLTAKNDERVRSRSLETGAQDYVLKPFASEELLARVHNLLTIKRTRDLLQNEVEAQQHDVEGLTRQLVAQKRELTSALQSAREARRHAEQASRAKSDFLSLVSHELRTPLTSIQLQLERVRRGVTGMVSSEQLQAMEKIARSSARLLDLLDALLEFGRMESGRLEVSLSSVDVSAVAREAIDDMRPRADQKGIALGLTLGEGALTALTDARLIRLIIVNLIDNAIKYTEEGSIELRLERAEVGLRLRVSDTGPGIDPAQQQLIFEPFQQLESVRHKRGEGVGLGLALVKSIAQALQAEVALDSAPGRGSAFTVTFASA